MDKSLEKKELPFATGFLTEPLSPRENVRLLGTKCHDCSAVLLGSKETCEACGSLNVEVIPLSREGKIWSYTIMRYPPPWVFTIPNPHQPPLPVAWVILPEGVQIISHIEGAPEDLHIDLPVELVIEKGWENEEGHDILMYRFRPLREQGR
jgi:uncharacterized OB-fold protein